jgi:hypothetical protein
VDDRCCTADLVAAGVREQLYDGRVHPYFAGDRDRFGFGQDHPGTKGFVVPGDVPASCSGRLTFQKLPAAEALQGSLSAQG